MVTRGSVISRPPEIPKGGVPDHHAVFQLNPPAGAAARARAPGGGLGLGGLGALALGFLREGSMAFGVCIMCHGSSDEFARFWSLGVDFCG